MFVGRFYILPSSQIIDYWCSQSHQNNFRVYMKGTWTTRAKQTLKTALCSSFQINILPWKVTFYYTQFVYSKSIQRFSYKIVLWNSTKLASDKQSLWKPIRAHGIFAKKGTYPIKLQTLLLKLICYQCDIWLYLLWQKIGWMGILYLIAVLHVI